LSMTLDTRRLKQKTGTYPVKLMVVYKSEPQRYQTIYDLKQEDYDKLSANRVSSELQEVRDNLKEVVRLAENSVKEIQPFSFDRFEKESELLSFLLKSVRYLPCSQWWPN